MLIKIFALTQLKAKPGPISFWVKAKKQFFIMCVRKQFLLGNMFILTFPCH